MTLTELLKAIDIELRRDAWFYLAWTNPEQHLIQQEQFKGYSTDDLLYICYAWQDFNGLHGIPAPHVDEAYPINFGDWSAIKAASRLEEKDWDRLDWNRINRQHRVVLKLRAKKLVA